MANKEKLPWDLVDEILSRVPPEHLVRFRTVCKRWNALFDDKAFINNHKMTFRFLLTTKSKIYSVSLKPEIEVRELTLDIPDLKYQRPVEDLVDCNGFLLCGMSKGAVVCNPWLNQTRRIEPEADHPRSLYFHGIGYDNNKRAEEVVYKTLTFYLKDTGFADGYKIHDFASDAWKDQEEAKHRTLPSSSFSRFGFNSRGCVSLNGTLYWVAYYLTHPTFFILHFSFSSESYSRFCDLPSGENDQRDALVLRVFRGGRFSLLKQCHVTKMIKIWVTKKKINNRYGGKVKWVSFMEVFIPNLPYLVETEPYFQPSYFIEGDRNDKRLVVCSCDENGRAWIYVMGENKLISRIQLDLDPVVDSWPLHCTYFPSLVLVPGGQRKEAKLQVNFSLVWLLVWLFRKLKVLFCLFGKINYFGLFRAD